MSMKAVWKYPIAVQSEQRIEIPEGALLLTVQIQGELPCLWAVVDRDAPLATLVLWTAGTGHPLPSTEGEYLSTYQLQSGALVFHVFARWELVPV